MTELALLETLLNHGWGYHYKESDRLAVNSKQRSERA
jgi:hypothetical protein